MSAPVNSAANPPKHTEGEQVAIRGRQRAFRFGVVGAANVVVDVAAFNLLLVVMGEPVAAKAISGCIAIVSSYAMNRRWTWADRDPGVVRSQLPAFFAVSLVGVAITEALLAVSHYVLGLRGVLADNLVANGLGLAVATVWRFYAYDRWVFAGGRSAAVREPQPARLPG